MGAHAEADLAIGADGVWSMVRRSLGLELFHQQTDEGALRTIIPGTPEDLGPDGQDKYIECWSGERRFLITPLNHREIYLALTCQKTDLSGKKSPLDKDSWKTSFPRWAHLIDRTDQILAWAPYSIVKVRSWSSGRTAIIGDAAHAQPPNLGQGGGMAMQSALALAVHLEGIADRRRIPDRLAQWEERSGRSPNIASAGLASTAKCRCCRMRHGPRSSAAAWPTPGCATKSCGRPAASRPAREAWAERRPGWGFAHPVSNVRRGKSPGDISRLSDC